MNSVWAVVFFEEGSHMRVCLNPHWNFQRIVRAINTGFCQLDGPTRKVKQIDYRCPYITLTDNNPEGTYMYYWDRVKDDVDVDLIFGHTVEKLTEALKIHLFLQWYLS